MNLKNKSRIPIISFLIVLLISILGCASVPPGASAAGTATRVTSTNQTTVVSPGKTGLPTRGTTGKKTLQPKCSGNLIKCPPWWNGQDCHNAFHPGAYDLLGYNATGSPITWRGLEVCGPLPVQNASDVPVNFFSGASTEQEFECTELVKRYIYLADNGLGPLGSTDGFQLVDHYTDPSWLRGTPFHKVSNDDPTSNVYSAKIHMAPTIGDVLSYGPTSVNIHGHTSIVIATAMKSGGNGTITVIQQNIALNDGTIVFKEDLHVVNWVIQKGYPGTVSSWMTTRPVTPITPGKSWHVVTGDTSVTNGALRDVVSLSNGEAYAVGWEGDPNGQGLVEHYRSGTWQKVTLPAGTPPLLSITASSPTDLWAVGGNGIPFVLHGNGTSWQLLSIPQFQTCYGGLLTKVLAFSPSNVWAVGRNCDGASTMSVHFDGTSWNIDNFSVPGALYAIAGTPGNLWAVGASLDGAIALSWNGFLWTTVSIPGNSASDQFLGVTVLSSTDVWVAGTAGTSALLSHWNGSAWTTVDTSASSPACLYSMASYTGDMFAAGDTCQFQNSPAVVYHWTGTNWIPTTVFVGDTNLDRPWGLFVASDHTVWMVGGSYTNFPSTATPIIWQYA